MTNAKNTFSLDPKLNPHLHTSTCRLAPCCFPLPSRYLQAGSNRGTPRVGKEVPRWRWYSPISVLCEENDLPSCIRFYMFGGGSDLWKFWRLLVSSLSSLLTLRCSFLSQCQTLLEGFLILFLPWGFSIPSHTVSHISLPSVFSFKSPLSLPLCWRVHRGFGEEGWIPIGTQ